MRTNKNNSTISMHICGTFFYPQMQGQCQAFCQAYCGSLGTALASQPVVVYWHIWTCQTMLGSELLLRLPGRLLPLGLRSSSLHRLMTWVTSTLDAALSILSNVFRLSSPKNHQHSRQHSRQAHPASVRSWLSWLSMIILIAFPTASASSFSNRDLSDATSPCGETCRSWCHKMSFQLAKGICNRFWDFEILRHSSFLVLCCLQRWKQYETITSLGQFWGYVAPFRSRIINTISYKYCKSFLEETACLLHCLGKVFKPHGKVSDCRCNTTTHQNHSKNIKAIRSTCSKNLLKYIKIMLSKLGCVRQGASVARRDLDARPQRLPSTSQHCQYLPICDRFSNWDQLSPVPCHPAGKRSGNRTPSSLAFPANVELGSSTVIICHVYIYIYNYMTHSYTQHF